MTGILKVDQWKDSGDNALMTSDGAGNLTANVSIAGFSSTGIDDNATSTAITIDSSQNVGVGTASPARKLDVDGQIQFQNSSSGRYFNFINDSQNSYLDVSHSAIFRTNGATSLSEAMRITSEGVIQAGNLNEKLGSGTKFLSLSGNGYATLRVRRGSDSGDVAAFYSFSSSSSSVGTISVTGSTTSYNTSSDYRLKENVVDMTGATERLQQLQPKRFNFIVDADTAVDGFLAHEVSSVVPEAVTGTKDAVDEEGNPVYQGIDQSKLVPLLTASLKEAIAKIEELETRIAALENA